VTADDRIEAFDKLGRIFEHYLESEISLEKTASQSIQSDRSNRTILYNEILENAVKEAGILNPWFNRQNVITAFSAISRLLNQTNLRLWLRNWHPKLLLPETPLTIGVIMSGNIPLAGIHDFLSAIISGHKFIGRLSSRDDRLLPAVAKLLFLINEELGKNVLFTEEKLSGIDAIIATGSNNTYRYFDYYFGKYPHIFRKNRNGAAILNGDETPDQIAALGNDIFTYFGLGCRSVSKIFIPYGYNLNKFLDVMDKFSYVTEHNKYMNNYQYYRSIYLLNKIPHSDNGFLLLKEDETYHSPTGVLYYEHYQSKDSLIAKLDRDKDLLQCIVSDNISGLNIIPFGKAQSPELWDYADNINTIDFLINLAKKTGHDF
jgi:hypothetical protein